MQKRGQPLHDEQDGHSESGEGSEDYRQPKEATPAPGGQTQVHHHGPEDLWQLCTHSDDNITEQNACTVRWTTSFQLTYLYPFTHALSR